MFNLLKRNSKRMALLLHYFVILLKLFAHSLLLSLDCTLIQRSTITKLYVHVTLVCENIVFACNSLM